MSFAPITIFVYNRPWHVRQTIESLIKNRFAKESELFIFSDGPKNEKDIADVREVRSYIKNISGFKRITVTERQENLGLAESIVSGVSSLVDKYGKIIVLEDDLILSSYFLTYMNDALELYKNEEKVMHISGYMYPIKSNGLPDTFFFNQASCWGWGTWKRAWKHLNTNPKSLLSKIYLTKKEKIFNYYGYYNFIDQLKGNIDGKLNTWAVKWYASIFLHNGLCLHPKISLVNNIGLDGSGENCTISNSYTIPKLATKIIIKKINLKEISEVKSRMTDFYKRNFNLFSKINQKIRNLSIFISGKIAYIFERNSRKKLNLYYPYELLRLKMFPRYTLTTTKLLDKKLFVPDSASFLSMYNEIFKKGTYKFNTFSNNPYIIDCGANIGLSIIYFKTIYPDADVIAFEPDKQIFSILTKNVQSFKLNKVRLVSKAIWSKKTTLNFQAEGADAGRIITTTTREDTKRIHTDCLIDYLNKPVALLKIDIEGAELEALESCKNKLHFVENLFIEYHSFVNQKQKLDKIIQILLDQNFKLYINSPGFSSAQPFISRNIYRGMDMQLNIYAYRI